MSNIFTNPNQLEEWVQAALGIRDRFGLDKALGYVIGEKFYGLVDRLHFARKVVREIEVERRKPDYNPVRDRSVGTHRYIQNLDELCEKHKEIIVEIEEVLPRFAGMIENAFEPFEIRAYFESDPRLGALGHIASEEEHELMISKGVIERSLETEVEDALIFGDMKKYFGIE